ncbi:hypothetical protein [Shivajiella indica]|uniref:Uncharacterized protein n=1 Tax=Shivajiella indica TaxID=872115 RepID=A0ABW5B5B5_9BACT
MKPTSWFIFLFCLLLSCSIREEEPSIQEEIITPPPVNRFNVCAFDLSDKEGEFPFISSWEYIGFWDSELRHMDNGTCLGRFASFYFMGEDPENPPKMMLEFLPKSSDPNQYGCENGMNFNAYGLLSKVTGCYSVEMPSIDMAIIEKEDYHPGAAITLEEAYADKYYFEGLEKATHFEIHSNKLFIFTTGPTSRMVFLAVED